MLDANSHIDVFSTFAPDYRFGNCFVRVYDHTDTATFGQHFIYDELYQACLASAPSRPYGTLSELCCGMADLSADAVCSYLHSRSPLLLFCVDKDSPNDLPHNPTAQEGESESDDSGSFDVIGFAFPSIVAGPPVGKFDPDPGRTALIGYTIFKPAYRTPEAVVCTMLMGVYFFHKFNLLTLQGQSYPWNRLTRKFLAQFGTRTLAEPIPAFLFDGTKMVDSYHSVLERSVFARYVEKVLTDCVSL